MGRLLGELLVEPRHERLVTFLGRTSEALVVAVGEVRGERVGEPGPLALDGRLPSVVLIVEQERKFLERRARVGPGLDLLVPQERADRAHTLALLLQLD